MSGLRDDVVRLQAAVGPVIARFSPMTFRAFTGPNSGACLETPAQQSSLKVICRSRAAIRELPGLI